MSTLAQADVFFFITSIAVIIISILWVVLLVFAIRFVRDLRRLLETIKEEMEDIVDDLDALRVNVKERAYTFSNFLGAITTARFLKSLFNKASKGKSRRRRSKEEDEL